MRNVWFMQDGATAHTSNIVLDFLNEEFDEEWFPDGNLNWKTVE